MKTIQEFGGFVLDAVRTHLNNDKESPVNELLHSLSIFDTYAIIESQQKKLSAVDRSVISVFYNLIQRGLPTRFSTRLEQVFSRAFPFIQIDEYRGSINPHFSDNPPENLTSLLEQAYHVIDPRLSGVDLKENYQYSWEQLDSTFEEDFYFNTLGKLAGDTSWLLQLVETQRPLTEIVQSEIKNKTLASNFIEQRCDFSIEFPLLIRGKQGIILEVDGKQHNDKEQSKLDQARDEAARESNWMETLRIPTQQWSNQDLLLTSFKQMLDEPFFKNTAYNYSNPMYGSKAGLTALQLALSPILIARIQKILLRELLNGNLDLKEKSWTICIIERDIPGSSLAIRDIEESLNYYSTLIKDTFSIPSINLHIYSTPEFIEAELHGMSIDKPIPIDELSETDIEYDLVIDNSVISRDHTWGVHKFHRTPKNYVVLTSAKSISGKRKIVSSQLLPFQQLTTKDDEGQYLENQGHKSNLEIFLADIFRKTRLRPGQLPILDRALRQQSVIGLLPTGGGKSMTYQIATLLQPGMTLIVDPIKSLMRDQVNSLTVNLIDCAGFVNSSQNRSEKEVEHKRLVGGELLFFFMSPERFLIQEFRELLKHTKNNGNSFSYCVIDEAHCVSEWGHDFRTSYLFLGRNSTRYAKTYSLEPITLFGLTATASYDVLADIQRELSGDTENLDSILSDEAIVRFETFNRPEMQYQVEAVNIPNEQPYRNIGELKKSLGEAKHRSVNELLSSMPHMIKELNVSTDAVYIPITDLKTTEEDKARISEKITLNGYDENNFWREDNEHAGIIFCPHRSWYFGVTDKYMQDERSSGVTDSILSVYGESNVKVGTFLGVDQEQINHSAMEEDNIKNQDAFINSDLNLMVCTKAFGMGIDKANVRLAIHLNYPQSIESYVQEAGRIGRDGKIALSCIAYNNQNFSLVSDPDDKSVNVDRQILMDFYNSSFPGKNKEKWNLFELLSGIESPPQGMTRQVESALSDEEHLDLSITLGRNQQGTINKLRINSPDNQKYGVLFFPNLNPATNFIDFPLEEAKVMLAKVQKTVRSICPLNTNVLTWLSQTTPGRNEPGIEAQLSEMEEGEEKQIILFFTNDISTYQQRVLEVLNRSQGNQAERLLGQYKRTSSIEAFTASIPDLSEDDIKEITGCYYKIRTKHDTEKALYRLALVGVVTDFTTDYKYNTFAVTIRKRSDEEYTRILRSYIRRYYSETRTQNILTDIAKRRGKNYIQKALNYIIEFLYREVAHKRKKAIDAIQEACEVGATQGNGAIKEYIDVYFNSKYGRAGFKFEKNGEITNGSLSDRTKEGLEVGIDIVWEFIEVATTWDLSGAQLVNLKHLRGACVRFLINNPKNYSLLLLKAFCTIVLEEERIKVSTLIDEAQKEIQQSFELILIDEGVSMVELIGAIEHYYDLLHDNSSRPELLAIIRRARELQMAHSNKLWLENFNMNFTVNYE